MTTTRSAGITIRLACDTARMQREDIEGPTRKQAARMATLRARWISEAREAEAAGDDDRAFDLDCRAWDLEMDLARYGFDRVTGRAVR